ncbi:MAG: ligase [Verrucomicrobiales bacterium]|nr:ligase [Verrucomicrobiales bacterium]
MNPPKAESVTLYYREGSSDKVYTCSIEPSDELFVVTFAYGRRGFTLSTGTKTSSPVDFETAKRIFDKLVREKTGKGYTPGENGTRYEQTDQEQRVTGIQCQLLNAIDEGEMEKLINEGDWCMQEKYDGRRVLVMRVGPVLTGVNRKGLTIGLPETIMKSAGMIEADFVLDGEAVGDTFFAFDLLALNGADLKQEPYRARLVALMNLLAGNNVRHIQMVQSTFDAIGKTILLRELRQARKEGVVFKRLDASYTPGRPNCGGRQLKHKFCATCSAVVANRNKQRSVELRLLDQDGWQVVGNVTIPPNHQVPSVGAVVEIRYLYAFPESHCLYQPVYLGERTDIDRSECLLAQLKYKPSEEE